jgi:hypothetical protein
MLSRTNQQRLIDLCEKLKSKGPRLASLAKTSYEEGAMWAVKAATRINIENLVK